MNLNEDIDINELVESVLKEQQNEESKQSKTKMQKYMIDDRIINQKMQTISSD